MRSLGSAYASVRADDGICALHERYVAASSVCAGYAVAGKPVSRMRSMNLSHCAS
jgi:hypothetical protein